MVSGLHVNGGHAFVVTMLAPTGDINAHRWNAMFALHLGAHYSQARALADRAPSPLESRF